MNYTLIFSTEDTINKKAHMIFTNNESLLMLGKDCEILYQTIFDNSKKRKDDEIVPFILVKYQELLLAGYNTYNHEERFDFSLDIINFNEVFKPTSTIYHYYATKKDKIFGELVFKINFDLSDIYPEMLNDYTFTPTTDEYIEYLEFMRGDHGSEIPNDYFEDKGNDFTQEEIL